jgi:ABC-2 type transport system ATP-binding protein
MTEARLSVRKLRVDYEDTTAVLDVDLEIEPGMVYGLIGPNGAGKTSIIRSIAALVDPTYGDIRIEGIDLIENPSAALKHVGYMPDSPPLYEDLTVYEFLELFASAYGVSPSQRDGRIRSLIDQVQLTAKVDSLCGGLSRGMRQRIFLAKCLLHDPMVLLLDEPASGLDPNARREFGELIKGLGAAGKAVLVSSHILSELSDFCNSVGIMEQGHMRVSGRIEDVISQLGHGNKVTVRALNAGDDLKDYLTQHQQISGIDMSVSGAVFNFDGSDDDLADLLKNIVLHGVQVTEFKKTSIGLEDIFQQVTDGGLA